jgi:hypothetical protein
LRVHENFLSFASLSLFHYAHRGAGEGERQIEVPYPLTTRLLSLPAWQQTIPILFEEADELALAYVDRIDSDRYLPKEVVIYGPRRVTERAYAKSVAHSLVSEPSWFEEWFIPQHELLLAQDDPDRIVRYGGQVHIRKITDVTGADL